MTTPNAATQPVQPIDILVLDDEESIRWVIAETLRGPDYRLHFAGSAEEAEVLLATQAVQMALIDINLPGDDGLTFLERSRKIRPEVLVAVITGEGTMHNAVTAMKLGAFDYLTKPFDIEEIESLVERGVRTIRQTQRHALRGEGRAPAGPEGAAGEAGSIIGRSRAVREVHKAIGRVAASDLTVLILGESGTGKELIARAIHQHSPRCAEPFVAVNCAAIPRDLLEAELFGFEKGAFTGATDRKAGRLESAGQGTIFLDEIGDMSLELQAKMLRVLQEREFQRLGALSARRMEARVIAATNQHLLAAVAEGRFRADLYYRLNTFPIHPAPLREIREDVPVLVRHFLRRSSEKLGVGPRDVTPEALERLTAHDWPGNVRELENLMRSLALTAHGPVIGLDDLPRTLVGGDTGRKSAAAFEEAVLSTWGPVIKQYCRDGSTGLLAQASARLELPLLREALRSTGWNQVRTAALLGINRNTLRSKMQALGIHKPTRKHAARDTDTPQEGNS